MYYVTVTIRNGSYIFQLQSSHQQAVYVRNTKGRHIPAIYIYLKIISGRYLGLTFKNRCYT
jgi:hypothetical protein